MSHESWNAVVPLADGVEEMEAVIAIDMLRRAGWTVQVAGLHGVQPVWASRGVRLVPDVAWEGVQWAGVDAMVLPGGGPGAEALAAHEGVRDRLRMFSEDASAWIAAVCAAPLALEAAGILGGRRYTSHPSVRDRLTSGNWVDEPVVEDGRLVTAQGPGPCMAWMAAFIKAVSGLEVARKVLGPMGL